MKTILLIRHGQTAGNIEKRYIGRTDEPLCAFGKSQARELSQSLPRCDAVFSSPLLRCHETACILFPQLKIHIVQDFRECDFGLFEGKTAHELMGDPSYNEWLNTNCTAPIPLGEDMPGFKAESCEAFLRTALGLPKYCTAAFVLHGGCIMAILERFARPKREFFDSHIKNCQYVVCALEYKTLTITGGAL